MHVNVSAAFEVELRERFQQLPFPTRRVRLGRQCKHGKLVVHGGIVSQ
jgi:hypothetical protein